MDKGLSFFKSTSKDAAVPLARCMIRCIIPILESDNPQAAQTILNCIRLICPQSDIRKLQGLTFYRLGQYAEAMGVYAQLNDMESCALLALCQRAIGETSWLGLAREVRDSGDKAAIAIIDPWMVSGADGDIINTPGNDKMPAFQYTLRA